MLHIVDMVLSVQSIPPCHLKVNFHPNNVTPVKKIYKSCAILPQHSYLRVFGEEFCSFGEKLPPNSLKTPSPFET